MDCFSDCFDDPEHADVLLHVATEAGGLEQTRSFHCHAILLSSRSAVFKARLSSLWQDTPAVLAGNGSVQAARSAKILHELVECVAPDEVQAMELLLNLMYSPKMPDPLPAPELLSICLRLADRLGALHAMDLLLSSLAAVTANTADYACLVQACSLPLGAWHRPACEPLTQAARTAATRLFGNVPAVIRNSQLRQQFCALPFPAVLAWAQADELEVHSENCVVFLLSVWVAAQRQAAAAGKSDIAPAALEPSAEQLEQLAHQVRVFHLGPAYLHSVLPSLDWFKSCKSFQQHYPTLLTYKQHGLKLHQILPERQHKTDGNWKGAEAWVARPRRACSMAFANEPSTSHLSWHLSTDEVQLLLDGQCVYSPATISFYLNGFLLRALLQRKQNRRVSNSDAEGLACTLGVFCGVDAPGMAAVADIAWNGTVLTGPYRMSISGPTAATCEQHGVPGGGFLYGSSGWGFPDFFIKAAATMQELMSPYLRAGRLQVEGSFTHVDVV